MQSRRDFKDEQCKTKAPDQNDLTPSVNYALTLSNFYTNQRKVLKFIEYWGRTVFQIKSERYVPVVSRQAREEGHITHVQTIPLCRDYPNTLIKNYSLLRLSDFVDFLETTDR